MKYLLGWIAICATIDILYIIGKVILGIVVTEKEKYKKDSD